MSKDRRRLRSPLVVALAAAFLVSSFSVLTSVNNVSAATGLELKWVANLGLGTYIGALGAHLIPGVNGMQIVVTGVTQVGQGFENGTISALSGFDGSVLWQTQANIQDHNPFEISDLNNDGLMEIIVDNTRSTLVLHGNNGSKYWQNDAAPSYFVYPATADVNKDGYQEVFVSSGRGPYLGVDYITELSYDGRILHQSNTSWHPCWGGLSIADPNFDGKFILFQGDRSIDYNEPDDPYKYGGWGLRALDAETLAPLWNDSEVLCSSHIPMLTDVDGDGTLDVVVAWQTSGLAVYNALDGSVLTSGGIYRKDSELGLRSHSQPTIYTDSEGHPQIITCSESYPIIWDLRSWTRTARLNVTVSEPPKMGRVTADNQIDIIVVESDKIHIYNQNFQELDTYGGLRNPNEFTLVQDVDEDGFNELIVTSRGGYVYCLGTPARASVPSTRSEVPFYSRYRLGVAEYVEYLEPAAPQIIAPSPANGAIGVPVTLSKLSFSLFDYQQDQMNCTVTTTPNIGGSLRTNLPNARYSVPIGGLNYSTIYSWTVNVTDGNLYNVMKFTFTTQTREQLTIEEQIQDVKDEVRKLVSNRTLDKRQGNALLTKLDAAVKSLHEGQDEEAIDRLRSFINQVDWFAREHILTQNEADTLVRLAEDIINRIMSGPIPGDINGDNTVGIYDAIAMSSAYGSSPSSSNWNGNADINGDNAVDLCDAIILSGNYGKSN